MMKVRVISPEGEMLSCNDAKAVFLPGKKGPFEVLDHHAPIITSLEKGAVRCITSSGEEIKVGIESGFAEVFDNVISVCAE
ncbi:MAG: F0F1 ATP synthase subunit epsilon [Bacteroidales bacterium]|nr:F0F1 ATP synthase subunit epsilon [Bacteroidales bacterium]